MRNILLILCPPVWHKLPPLGLAYVSEYLRSTGYNVDVVDLNVEEVNILEQAGVYDEIGFSVFKSNEIETLALVKKVKEKYPRKIILLGGPQCFSWQYEVNPDEVKLADELIVGDYVLDLDASFPTFDGFRLDKYERKRALPILSSRGCIRTCAFCSERLLSKGFTIRRPENVLKEIQYHKKINKTKWFTFHDSLINGDLNNLDELCDMLLGENIVWDAQAIIRRDMPEDLLSKMKKGGCFNLFIGLESGSSKMLKLMRKGFTTEDAEVFFTKCRNVGLHFETSLIAGFPGETEEDFAETLKFIEKNKDIIPKIAQINPYIKYSGTEVEAVNANRGSERTNVFIRLVEELGIPYTKDFINNLVRGK